MASATASQVHKPRGVSDQQLLTKFFPKEARVSPNRDAAQIHVTKHEAITDTSATSEATTTQQDRLTALPTETLEQVLLNVDMATVLTSQRVSTVFRDVVQDSKALRQHAWLEPPDNIVTTRSVCREHGQKCPDQMRNGTPIDCQTEETPCVKLNPMFHRFLVKHEQEIVKVVREESKVQQPKHVPGPFSMLPDSKKDLLKGKGLVCERSYATYLRKRQSDLERILNFLMKPKSAFERTYAKRLRQKQRYLERKLNLLGNRDFRCERTCPCYLRKPAIDLGKRADLLAGATDDHEFEKDAAAYSDSFFTKAEPEDITNMGQFRHFTSKSSSPSKKSEKAKDDIQDRHNTRPGIPSNPTLTLFNSLTTSRFPDTKHPSYTPIEIPIENISIRFSKTVKQLTKLVEQHQHEEASWMNMPIFSPPNPFPLSGFSNELAVSYIAYEKLNGYGEFGLKWIDGKYIEREHKISVGKFDGVVITIKDLIERVLERHRDIYMEI